MSRNMTLATDRDEVEVATSLDELALRIRDEHAQATAAARSAIAHAIEAGRLLIDAKARLDHGAWLPWLSAHCEQCPTSIKSRARNLNRAGHCRRCDSRLVGGKCPSCGYDARNDGDFDDERE